MLNMFFIRNMYTYIIIIYTFLLGNKVWRVFQEYSLLFGTIKNALVYL